MIIKESSIRFEDVVRENNAYANKTWKYYYDNSGNITMRDEYAYTTGTLPSSCSNVKWYAYSTGAWGDLLTNYDGNSITYDTIGNPKNWSNSTLDVRYMVWSGRQLTALTRDMLDHTLSFNYNADGVRIRKSNSDYVNSQWVDATHEYTLDGATILREKITTTLGLGANATTSTDVLYYHYDESGVAGFELNGTNYYFLKNIQGDVINILNSSGQVVVTYSYDAWGKVLSVTGSQASTLGQINPFRYRGYYYDTETGFYYLQTRYYDPEVGRFINADGIIGANGGIPGFNLFAYCNNNPVMYSDPTGLMTAIEIGEKYGYGSPEYVLAEHYETYYAKDNFDAEPTIKGLSVRFSEDEIVRAIQNIDYQTTPQILSQYSDRLGETLTQQGAGCVTKSVGVSIDLVIININLGIAADDSGDGALFVSVSASNTISAGFSAFYSTTYNSSVSAMEGHGLSLTAALEIPTPYSYGYSVTTDGASITSTHSVGKTYFNSSVFTDGISLAWSYGFTITFGGKR